MNTPNINWNQVWRDHHAAKIRSRGNNIEFWNKRAPEFNRAASGSDYVDQFIDLLAPEPDWTILDIGAAAGTLAVPLSGKCRSITALEPSPVMKEILNQRCRENNITNIRVVDGRWQDDWDALNIGVHDVAFASRSLLVEDLAEAVTKLEKYARKKVYLSTLVEDGPYDRRLLEAVGREFSPGMNYTTVFNILSQIGIYPNLTFTVSWEDRTYVDLDEAVGDMTWMFHEISPEEENRLRSHLDRILVRVDTGLKMPYRHITRWAVMWWDKERID